MQTSVTKFPDPGNPPPFREYYRNKDGKRCMAMVISGKEYT